MVVESNKMGDNLRRRNRVRVTGNQLELIVKSMEDNSKLFEGGMSGGKMEKAGRNEFWIELARQLNDSRYGGAIKKVIQWQKCWTDKKLDCKSKYKRIRAAKEEGKPQEEILYDLEARILTLIGIDVTDLPTTKKALACSPKIVDESMLATDNSVASFDQVPDDATSIEEILTGNSGSLPLATVPDESSQPAPQRAHYQAILPKRSIPDLDPKANKKLKESAQQLKEPNPLQVEPSKSSSELKETFSQQKESPSQPKEPPPKQKESPFQVVVMPAQLKESPSQAEGSEFEAFCQSLSIQLKRMPLHRALICQEKLQSVMTQERLFQLTQPKALLAASSAYHHSLSILNSSQHEQQ